MNERIRELANQLGPVATIGNWGRIEWADNVYPQLGDKMYAAIDLQKFAELIVRECIEICNQAILQNQDTLSKLNTDELAEKMIIHGSINQAQKLGKGIKEHFGVEL